VKDRLAFGVEPDRRRYRLRLARYRLLADSVAAYVAERQPTPAAPLDLLDVGVGSGRSLRFLEAAGVADRIRFHAVDLKPQRLDKVYARDRWQLTQADVNDGLPFPDATFDVLICEQVLEHLTDARRSIAEMARVLRPGGLFILGVPTFPRALAALRPLALRVRERLFGIREGHVLTFTAGDVRRLVESSGAFERLALRGARVLSGGVFSPLEDFAVWYRFNRWLGARLPGLCVEVQAVARRRSGPIPHREAPP
jgi:SAM-dependent methyltransferase